MRSLKNKKGFSLLEILVAVSILAISMVVILGMHGQSMIKSGRAEEITVATMLSQMKLAELQIDLEKDISKGEMPADNKEIEGSFDAPYEDYKWKAAIKKVEMPVPPQPETAGGTGTPEADTAAEGAAAAPAGSESLQMDIFYKMFKTISEEVAKVARSITVTVAWEELGEERSVNMTTHVIKLQ